MIESDWGRWLIDDVEAATPQGLAMWYLGCNGFILKSGDGTTLYIDPYLGLGDPPRTVRMIPVPFDPASPSHADGVVVTHEHTDHLHGPSQGPILSNTGAELVASPGCIDLASERGWAETYDIDASQLRSIEAGDQISIGAVDITAYRGTDPDAAADLTYVFEVGDSTVVHPGDGRPADVLSTIADEHAVDIAIAAVGSSGMIPDKETGELTYKRWYNDPNECVAVAEALEADVLIPTHWDMWKGLTTDPSVLRDHARSFESPGCVEVLEIGDRFDLTA